MRNTSNEFHTGTATRLLTFSLVSSTLLFASIALAQTDAAPQPDGAAAEIASGIQLLRDKSATEAKLKFSAGVRANPQSADALTWRGIAENQLKQYSEAVRDFQAALRINSDEMSAHYNLGLSFLRVAKTDAAIEQFRIVVAAHPGVVEPEYNLAILLEGQQKTAEAVDHLQAAYKSQPSDIGVTQHLLVDLLVLGETNEAQPILQALLDNSSPEAKQDIATALIEANQFDPATRLLEAARVTNASSHEADLLLARAYIGTAKYSQAVDLLQPISSNDGTGESSYLLALAYSGQGLASEAQSSFEAAIKLNPRNAEAHYHLGLIEAAKPGGDSEALHHLREAARLDPENTAFGVAFGRILLQHDQAAEAVRLLQHLEGSGPVAGERDLLLGIAQISLGNARQAVPVLEHAVTESPSLALAQNILGFCYFQQGDYAKAADFYEKGSDLQPQLLVFAHDAAIALERSNNSDQAMIYAARAIALPAAGGDDHYLVAKLLAKSGRKEDAIQELKKSVSLSPDLDESYYLLARTYMQVGDVAQAAEWNVKLAELKQKHAVAYAAKGAKPVSSSTLLQGAPMPSEEKPAQ